MNSKIFLSVFISIVIGALGSVAIARDNQQHKVKICIAEKGKPTDNCISTADVEIAKQHTLRKSDPSHVQIRLSTTWDKTKAFREFAAQNKDAEICIIEGANICPPEPFELIWVCITTGMLAGTECPVPPESKEEPRARLIFSSTKPTHSMK